MTTLALAGALACGSGSSTGGGASAVTTTYVISGKIAGESGVTVNLSGTSTATTTTDASGNYAFGGLASGNYTVTPTKPGYRCSPVNRDVTVNGADVTGLNFTAAATHTVAGKVTGASSVTVSLSGALSGSTTTDSTGSYGFAVVDGDYTVTPTKSGFAFTPLNATATVKGADVTVSDFVATSAPNAYSISGSVSGVSGATVSLSGANTGTVTADASGHYVFSGLLDGKYTLTPIKFGYTFTPPSVTVTVYGADIAGQHFTANTYSISGNVTGAADASNVRVSLSGPATATTTTDAAGYYKFSGLGNLTYTLVASKNGYMFTPSTAYVAVNRANVTGQDFVATAHSWYPDAAVLGIRSLWGSAVNDIWALASGSYGAILLHWDGHVWTVLPSPMSQTGAIWGASANDIWIAGGYNTAHWDGSAWMPMALPSSLAGGVIAVFGAASDDVWAVGQSGAIVHWNGTTWKDETWKVDKTKVTTNTLEGGWTDGHDVWVTGDNGTLVRWDGEEKAWKNYTDTTNLTARPIRRLWGTSKDLWAVGGDWGSVILHWDGTAWTKVAHPGTSALYDVWGGAADDVWAVGTTILHWNGTAWEDRSQNSDGTYATFDTLFGLVGFGPDSILAAGGSALLWNGSTWTNLVPSPTSDRSTPYLSAVSGSAANDVWAVGNTGAGHPAILHSDGSTWQDKTPKKADGTYLTLQGLQGVSASTTSDAWIVGWGGTILRWDGTAWTESGKDADGNSVTSRPLFSVWSSGPGDAWAVGDSGTILRWDGTAWTDKSANADNTGNVTWSTLYCVFGIGPNDVWAVGDYAFLHWDGTAWTNDSSPFTQVPGLQAKAIWGSSATDLWIAGSAGGQGVAHFDGTSWKKQILPIGNTTGTLMTIWGTGPTGAGPTDVWAGWDVGFYHWNGSAWSQVPMPTPIHGIWGAGGNLIAASNGGIYRLDN